MNFFYTTWENGPQKLGLYKKDVPGNWAGSPVLKFCHISLCKSFIGHLLPCSQEFPPFHKKSSHFLLSVWFPNFKQCQAIKPEGNRHSKSLRLYTQYGLQYTCLFQLSLKNVINFLLAILGDLGKKKTIS